VCVAAVSQVETLLFFASAGTVETFADDAGSIRDACFPAARLRQGYKARAPPSAGVTVECDRGDGISVDGVWFGRACIDNPPCGQNMTLVPAPTGCGAPVVQPLAAGAAGTVYGECPSISQGSS